MLDLAPLFRPRSIAVVGASAEAAKIGARPLLALEANGYAGEVYPVNPKYEEIGRRRCYPSVQAIPSPVDLAIVALPAPRVPAALRDCAAKQVGVAVIFSAGFAEAGPEGQRLQDEVREIVHHSSLRVLGPNTAGSVYQGTAAVASFASVFMHAPQYRGDGVAFVTQSGAFGVYVYNLAQQMGLGFDYYVNTGNEVDLEVSDVLEYLADDRSLKAVTLYLEGVRDGPRFRHAAEKCLRRGLPVIAVKVGRSEAASRAALSHTGALTGADEVYEAVFRQSGIARVDGIMEMLDLLGLVVRGLLPEGRRVGILTTTGGGGVWTADKCRQVGLEVPEFGGSLRDKLAATLPAFAAASNPVDLTGQMYTDRQLFRRCVNILTEEGGMDAVVVVSGGAPETAGANVQETIVEAARSSRVPVVVNWVGAPPEFYRELTAAGVPTFADPSRGVRALGTAAAYAATVQEAARRQRGELELSEARASEIRSLCRQLASPEGRLAESAAKQVLSRASIPVSETRTAESVGEALALAEQIGYPVVLKVESPDLLHRSEAGAVALDLRSADQVRAAYKQILEGARAYAPQARDLRVTVQAMLGTGVELLAGLTRDAVFGSVLTVGLGGIWAEALHDTSVRVPPISAEEATAMLMELRGSTLLRGLRHSAPADVEAAAQALVRLSDLAMALGDTLVELDVNPLIVFPKGGGAAAADALVVIRPE